MPDKRYRVTDRIAAGGMAEVFRGVAESMQGFRKSIAIKRILPALTKHKKFVAMFLDEARLSLHLQHANIVQVFDIGHADETYFIVMEYVDGTDLKQILGWRRRIGRRLTIGQTIYIMMEICKGLAYAHDLVHPETGLALGIVHRDVSPPNVLFSRNGEVKLADFGLAKAANQLETTDPGVVKGKMSYLSPEAARGDEVDQRADIFAVGILLYEMLTGKRLFYGDTDYQTVELVRAAKIPPIAPQNAEVEDEIEEICRKALNKRVEDRFQSATDLQDVLAQYLFSRGLKVLQRDIADLVRGCLEDAASVSSSKRPKLNIVDTLLQQEINAFTSDFGEPGTAPLMAADFQRRPTIPNPLGAPDDLIDPRGWADDPDWPGRRTPASRRPSNHGRRPATPTFQMEPGAAPALAPGRRAAAIQSVACDPTPVDPVPPTLQPTPGPEALADALEPVARRAAAVHPTWLKWVIVTGVLAFLSFGAFLISLATRN